MYEQSTLNERQLNTGNDVQANTPASSDQPLNVGCPRSLAMMYES